MILKAYDLLKPGGTMVYSTCSIDPEENEGVVSYLLEKTNAKLLKTTVPGLKTRPALLTFAGKTYNKKVAACLRIHPQDNDSEGFFISHVHKPRENNK